MNRGFQICSMVLRCKLRDSPAVPHSMLAAAAVTCLCLHYTYLSYMTDCHFVYVILLECCSNALYSTSTFLSNLLLSPIESQFYTAVMAADNVEK